MSKYPRLDLEIERRGGGIEELAVDAGVDPLALAAVLEPGRAPSLELRQQLSTALDIPMSELFVLVAHLEACLVDAEERGFPRHITDPSALRLLGRPV